MNETLKKFTEELKGEMLKAFASPDIKEFVEKTKAATDTGSFEVIISTADIDRQGESVAQDGWDLSNYLSNPVVLWGHDYWSLPIGICDEIALNGGKLVAKGRFAPAEANPFAQQVRQLYDLKIVRATSVGFIVKEAQGNVITKAELLEFSFVPVPANPYALSLSKAQTIGLDLSMLATKGLKLEVKAEGDACTMEDGTEGVMQPDADGNLVCAAKPQAKKTKPDICEPDNPNYDPQACAAIFCDPQSPEYNHEYCDLMKPKSAGAVHERIRSHMDTLVETIKSAAAATAEKIIEAINVQESAASEQLPEGGAGEEPRDGGAPKQRSIRAGYSDKEALNEFLSQRQVLRLVNNVTSEALRKLNERVHSKIYGSKRS